MRAGRELELLVAHLEAILVPAGAVVKSPDRLPDRVTGCGREVDVSITMRIGSVDVVVVAECRDRRQVEDVTWIEQLAQKRDDLNVARAIAISSTGFSEAAIAKARFYGIDLRRLEELTVDTLEGWFRIRQFTLVTDRVQFRSVALEVHAGARIQRGLVRRGTLNLQRPIFSWSSATRRVSAADLWEELRASLDTHSGVPQDGTKVARTLEAKPLPRRLQLHLSGVIVPLASIRFSFDAWFDTRSVPLHRVYSYRSDQEHYLETIEYLLRFDDHEEIVAIHKNLRAGSYHVTRRGLKGEPRELPMAWFRIVDENGVPLSLAQPEGALAVGAAAANS